MSTAVGKRSVARAFVSVAFAPLTFIERARGRARMVLVAAYLAIGAIVSGYAIREYRLGRVPDPGDPFDVAAFRSTGAEDAMPLYREAYKRFRPPATTPVVKGGLPIDMQVRSVRGNWMRTSPEVQAWIDSNREALELWRRATERKALGYVRWDRRGFGADWYDLTESGGREEDFQRGLLAWLADREAGRLREAGDLAGAWAWHRALLRHSRHLGMRAIVADRREATAKLGEACDRAELWSLDPGVDAAMLRRALADALDIGAMAAPVSDAVKADYLEALSAFDHPSQRLINAVVDEFTRLETAATLGPAPDRLRMRAGWSDLTGDGSDVYQHHLPGIQARLLYFLAGEPRRSRRLVRQVYAHWLAHCDDPPARKPPTVTGLELFQAPPASPRLLSTQELIRELERPGPARHVLSSPWVQLRRAIDAERARHASLVIHLAEQLFLRTRGRMPDSPRDLVGPFLDALPEGYVESAETRARPARDGDGPRE